MGAAALEKTAAPSDSASRHVSTGRVTSAGPATCTSTIDYNGLGHVLESRLDGQKGTLLEIFERNGFGAATLEHHFPPNTDPQDSPGKAFDISYYQNHGGSENSRVEVWKFDSHPNPLTGWEPGGTSHGYDGKGNRVTTLANRFKWEIDLQYQNATKEATYDDAAKSYYSADDRLRVHQVVRDSVVHNPPNPDLPGDAWGP